MIRTRETMQTSVLLEKEMEKRKMLLHFLFNLGLIVLCLTEMSVTSAVCDTFVGFLVDREDI